MSLPNVISNVRILGAQCQGESEKKRIKKQQYINKECRELRKIEKTEAQGKQG